MEDYSTFVGKHVFGPTLGGRNIGGGPGGEAPGSKRVLGDLTGILHIYKD